MRRPLAHSTETTSRNGSSSAKYSASSSNAEQLRETFDAVAKTLADLPSSDNIEGAVEKMLRANAILRLLPWPKPFDETTHQIRVGDARDLSWLSSDAVHLVVTSPPYWTLKDYEPHKY